MSQTPPPLSAVLRGLAAQAQGDITLGGMVGAFGERSFGAAILLFAAPNVIPLPPGSSALFGLPLLFITAQLMVGRHTIWLPRRLLQHRLPAATLKTIIDRLLPHLEKIEVLVKPRSSFLISAPAERLAGFACFLLSIILFLPIPGANIPPALGLSLFALGLIGQDSLFMLAGWALTAATGAILYVVGDVAATIVSSWLDRLFGL